MNLSNLAMVRRELEDLRDAVSLLNQDLQINEGVSLSYYQITLSPRDNFLYSLLTKTVNNREFYFKRLKEMKKSKQ